jgi:hypothetical protein
MSGVPENWTEIEDVDQSMDNTYVYIHLIEAAYSVTPEDAERYFHHCGYL